MAKQSRSNHPPKPSGKDGTTPRFNSRAEFIEGFLGEADKKWLQDNSNAALEHILRLIDEIGDVYTLSCKYDSNSSRFMATLTCRVDDNPNTGCILVQRASSPTHALYALSYKHFVKYEGVWGNGGSGDRGLWD